MIEEARWNMRDQDNREQDNLGEKQDKKKRMT